MLRTVLAPSIKEGELCTLRDTLKRVALCCTQLWGSVVLRFLIDLEEVSVTDPPLKWSLYLYLDQESRGWFWLVIEV